MAEITKYQLVPNNNINNNNNIGTDFKGLFSLFRTKKSAAFVYGVVFVFVAFTVFLAFSPSSETSPWFINFFTLNTTSPPGYNDDSFRSDYSTNFTQFPEINSSRSHNITSVETPMSDSPQNLAEKQLPPDKVEDFKSNKTDVVSIPQNATILPQISSKMDPILSDEVKKSNPSNNTDYPQKQSDQISPQTPSVPEKQSVHQSNAVNPQISPQTSSVPEKQSINQNNGALPPQISPKTSSVSEKQINNPNNAVLPPQISPKASSAVKQQSNNQSNAVLPPQNSPKPQKQSNNQSNAVLPPQVSPKISKLPENSTGKVSGEEEKGVHDFAASLSKKQGGGGGNGSVSASGEAKAQGKNVVGSLVGCDLYDGEWVRDESYPLYKPGSCKLIDEQFDCPGNGRPDNDYQKLKWKPKGCTIPRMDGGRMLRLLRGKRLVFIGDSLNRNMWESLVCILKNSVKNPENVFEAAGRHYFRAEASYSFVFKDYNCTVEFFVAPFLVQQWEVKDKKGTTKETLRLDLVVRDSQHFKNADFVIFNTGHWWTHEKTSKGEDYYQEGTNVYKQLDVTEAFRKAITTWGRWVDSHINPQRTHVFFRGYSSTHFSGGQWNSGGQCDSQTEPIRNEKYLTKYPKKMKVLEEVLKGMKTPVSYLNITKLTDYRKDGHPSVYRKHQLSAEEKKTPLRFQDCSHWCLPGVPDSWNELLYAEILRKQYQDQQLKNKT